MSPAESFVIEAAPVSAEAFAPFGTLVSAAAPPDAGVFESDLYAGRDQTALAATLDADHPVEVLALRSKLWDGRVRYLERHTEIAQAFIPIGGTRYAVVVAPADAVLGAGEVPSFGTIRAFVVPGDVAVVLHRDTWHEPPLALVEGGMALVTSHSALTAALNAGFDADGEIHTGDVDKRDLTRRTGVEVRVDVG